MDQVFVLRQVVEIEREREHKVYMTFLNLEKAHDHIEAKGLWKVLQMYGVEGKLLSGIKCFDVNSKVVIGS